MFFTLALCLLTQPFGNLLYSYSNNWFSKLMFLTWRLNPVLCLAEAISICVVLISNMPKVWERGHIQPFRIRLWRQRLQITAAALLLLRAKAREDNGTLVLKRLYEEQESSTNASHTTQAFDPDVAPSTPATSIRRSMTTEEGGLIDRLLPVDAHNVTLKQALGSNALSHSEITVDVFTLVTVICIIIKLGFIVMPCQIKFAAACMITGWLAVQALLLLLHTGELSELDMHGTVRTAWKFRYMAGFVKPKDSPWVNNITITGPILLLAWGYLTYLFFESSGTMTTRANLLGIMAALLIILLVAVIFFTKSSLLVFFTPFLMLSVYLDPSGLLLQILGMASLYLGVLAQVGFICFPIIAPASNHWTEVMFCWFNIVFTLIAFGFMFLSYQEEGTSKPGWLDIFGKVYQQFRDRRYMAHIFNYCR